MKNHEAAAAGGPAALQTPAGMTLNEQLTYIMNQVQGLQLEVNTIDNRTRPRGETKTEDEPLNTVNTAIDKEKYAKDDDVKNLAKIVIPETVRAVTTNSFAS